MPDPSLVRVTIEELSVQAYLGVHDREQRKPTEIKIDVEFEYKRPTTDTLGGAIDYAALRDTVLSAIDNRRFALVETVAETILYAVKVELQMTWVSVRVRKLGALRQASSVAAFVEWRQAEPANKHHSPR
jgi:dihydroneopterin aldolase